MTVPSHPATSQLRLFAQDDEFKFDTTFGKARRTALDDASWVEHVPGWLSGNAQLLSALAEIAGWEQRQRWMFTELVMEPRMTAEYPVLAEAPSAELRAIGQALSDHYDVAYDRAWLNLYRDHSDSTGWHADRPASKRLQATVPVLSLGETRRFSIRHRDGGRSKTFVVEGGDLIVMGGRCQRDWVHCVPKETRRAGMRISINFASSAVDRAADVP
jgi:alkylated DNA repair dioxygenase AlkB